MNRKQLYWMGAAVLLFIAAMVFLKSRSQPLRPEAAHPLPSVPSAHTAGTVQLVVPHSQAGAAATDSVVAVALPQAAVVPQPDEEPPASGHYRISTVTMFAYDSATIRPEAYPDLNRVGRFLGRSSAATARIEMHTDKLKKSTAPYSRHLSQRRADAVKAFFVEKFAIDPRRLEAIGCGFDSPLAPNDPEKGNPVNRRVDISIGIVPKGTMKQP